MGKSLKKVLSYLLPPLAFILLILPSCKKHYRNTDFDEHKPQPTLSQYFDSKYLLYKLPVDYYKANKPGQSFGNISSNGISLMPFGYNASLNLQYTHVYSNKCVYHT